MLRYKEFQEELQPNFNSFNKQVRPGSDAELFMSRT